MFEPKLELKMIEDYDYEGVKLSVIENILRYNIPNLKNKISKILEDLK